MQRNPQDYSVLGLSENADIEQIKKAGTVLMKRYKDDPEKLEAVNAAYNRLMGYSTNEEKKEETKKGTGFFKFLRKN